MLWLATQTIFQSSFILKTLTVQKILFVFLSNILTFLFINSSAFLNVVLTIFSLSIFFIRLLFKKVSHHLNILFVILPLCYYQFLYFTNPIHKHLSSSLLIFHLLV